MSPETPASAPAPVPAPASRPGASILIIDSDSLLRRVVRTQLSRENYRVEEAGDAARGLELARATRPDLILLDIQLPDRDGHELLAELGRDAATGEIPVIVVSEKGTPEERARGLEAGASDFILKPFNPKELLARVQVNVRTKRARDEIRVEAARARQELSETRSVLDSSLDKLASSSARARTFQVVSVGLAFLVVALFVFWQWSSNAAERARMERARLLGEAIQEVERLQAAGELQAAIERAALALEMDPSAREAKQKLLGLYLDQCETMAELQRREEARSYWTVADTLAGLFGLEEEFRERLSRLEREVKGIGTLAIVTSPAGAKVSIQKIDPETFVPGNSRELGRTPLAGVEVEMGSHLLLIELDGHRKLWHPVLVKRNKLQEIDDLLLREEPRFHGMVQVPGGSAILGGENAQFELLGGEDSAQPLREVEVGPFLIDKTEVTNADYGEFVRSSPGVSPPGHWTRGNCPAGSEQVPVYLVSWKDADAYCRFKGKRLPTIEEWEKAARGVDGRIYPWGNQGEEQLIKARDNLDGSRPLPVGVFPSGASIYGCMNMAGNVQEWTSSPAPKDPTKRLIAGGSFSLPAGQGAAANSRMPFFPESSTGSLGFRCAMDLPAQ